MPNPPARFIATSIVISPRGRECLSAVCVGVEASETLYQSFVNKKDNLPVVRADIADGGLRCFA